MTELKLLPLDRLHRDLGGRMVPFAGYEMPVQYPAGIKTEHLQVRRAAGLFDVSHMGQAFLRIEPGKAGADPHASIAAAIERLVPGEILKLPRGRIRYTVLLNEAGGILDDLMITRPEAPSDAGSLFLVVNAAVKDADFARIATMLAGTARLEILEDRALLALQGPAAAAVMARLCPGAETMPFMSMRATTLAGVPIYLSRCGYTGEDGYELSVPAASAEMVARTLLDFPEVEPIGLGARDSLRLEAGLCLYGHDMSPAESPIEASIGFAIGKRRREEGGFPGHDRIIRELTDGASKLRVGLRPEGRAPAREGAEICAIDGSVIGVVTSGGFGPTLDAPLAMGYVPPTHAAPGTRVNLMVRGNALPAIVVTLPFVEQRYFRGSN